MKLMYSPYAKSDSGSTKGVTNATLTEVQAMKNKFKPLKYLLLTKLFNFSRKAIYNDS